MSYITPYNQSREYRKEIAVAYGLGLVGAVKGVFDVFVWQPANDWVRHVAKTALQNLEVGHSQSAARSIGVEAVAMAEVIGPVAAAR